MSTSIDGTMDKKRGALPAEEVLTSAIHSSDVKAPAIADRAKICTQTPEFLSTPTNTKNAQRRRASSITVTVETDLVSSGPRSAAGSATCKAVAEFVSGVVERVAFLPPPALRPYDVPALVEGGSDPRWQELAGKRLLFVCCGHGGLDSKKFAFERAKRHGARVVLLEDPKNELAHEMHTEGILEHFLAVDMTPRASLVDDCLKAVTSQPGEFLIDGALTFWDDAVGLLARLANKLNVPGHAINAVDCAHDKFLTRRRMEAAGLPVPAYHLIKSPKDLAKAKETVTVPAILKPMYGASSLAVLKVEKYEEWETKYHEVVSQLEEFYAQGELMGLTFDDSDAASIPGTPATGFGFERSSLHWVVAEEFLDGDEVDVDLIMQDGEVVYECVVDDWPQIQPWFAEMGNTCPSTLPDQAQRQLADMAIKTAKVLGFSTAILHCELKWTTAGTARIIEINPRMGGGPVYHMHKRAFGVDLVDEQLYQAANIKPTVLLQRVAESSNKFWTRPDLRTYVACGEKFFEKSMRCPSDLHGSIQAIAALPGVVEAAALVEINEAVVGIQEAFPTRTARFVVETDVSAEASHDYAQSILMLLDNVPAVMKLQKK